MSQICLICTNTKRDKIDRALLSFTLSLRDIADQFGLANHIGLYRHLNKCLSEEYALAKRERAEMTVTTIQEIAGGMTEIMRFDSTELFDDQGRFDIEDIRSRGLGHMIKSFTIEQKKSNGNKDGNEPAQVIKFETYSRLDAMKALGSMWIKLKINDDANRRTDAMRRVAQQNLDDYISAGLTFEDAITEVERDLPGARKLLDGR